MPQGLRDAMLIHSAGESSPGAEVPPETHAVSLTCADEAEMRSLADRLTAMGVRHRTIVEDGRLVALGIFAPKEVLKRTPLASLPLSK